MTHTPTPQQLDNSAAFTAHQARLTRRADAAASLVVALAMAIVGAIALVSYLTPCDAGQLCTLAAVAGMRRVRAGTAPQSDSTSFLHPGVAAVRRAAEASWADGERHGYVVGTRWGVLCGACLALPVGIGLGFFAVHLGLGW